MCLCKRAIHTCLRRAGGRSKANWAIVFAEDYGAAMNIVLQEKIRGFRDRAQQSKLKANFSEEYVVRKIYEDAARQWEKLADNLEKSGRPY